MSEKKFMTDPSPWTPMTNLIDLKHLGKLGEECNECGAAVSRCIIQGIDEAEPSTGEINKHWLTKEIADVLANAELCIERFGLDMQFIHDRKLFKQDHLRRWHAMGSAYQEPQP